MKNESTEDKIQKARTHIYNYVESYRTIHDLDLTEMTSAIIAFYSSFLLFYGITPEIFNEIMDGTKLNYNYWYEKTEEN